MLSSDDGNRRGGVGGSVVGGVGGRGEREMRLDYHPDRGDGVTTDVAHMPLHHHALAVSQGSAAMMNPEQLERAILRAAITKQQPLQQHQQQPLPPPTTATAIEGGEGDEYCKSHYTLLWFMYIGVA